MLGEFVDLKTMVGSRRVADRPQDAILPTNPTLDAGFTTPSSGTRGLVVWAHGCRIEFYSQPRLRFLLASITYPLPVRQCRRHGSLKQKAAEPGGDAGPRPRAV